MSIRRGGQFPYPEFRERYSARLSMPDGRAEIVRDTAVAYQVVRSGDQTTAHAHSWWHLFVVRSGTGSIVFANPHEQAELHVGDIVLVPAWVTHHFDNPGVQGDLVLLNLMNIPQLADLGNISSRERDLADEPV
jgi:mannose-6-phosphate isomerase-like protein (cupin superfamily)